MTGGKSKAKKRLPKGKSFDNARPQTRLSAKRPVSMPLVIGIGASAGGLEAFRGFFAHMPADTGMAFVLIQHLSPHHPSILVELIGRQTAMKVAEGSDGLTVASNCVYVIPPNATLTIKDRVLRVSTPAPPRELRRPIDAFFSALAHDQGERAVCVVPSGTGADGTVGLRAIKEHGGLTLAQSDTNSAVMSGMPQSAAATGLVDHLIPVADMPALLIDYQRHLNHVSPRKDGDGNRRDMSAHVAAICALVRAASGHDFSQYKHATLLRRIQRRMQVLRDVVAGELKPYRDDAASVAIEGAAEIILTPKATQTLSLALHELATNAAKYGALSTPAGKVKVAWSVAGLPAMPRLLLTWTETGGPPVQKPTRRGFGSDLTERIARSELQASVERSFDVQGVCCRIEFPLTDSVGYVGPNSNSA